jgi:hypothetical protein
VQARVLAEAGQHQAALACLEALLLECGDDADPETRRRAAAAVREKVRAAEDRSFDRVVGRV